MAQLRIELGGIRVSEKDMVIQYERPEEVIKANQQWSSCRPIQGHAGQVYDGPEQKMRCWPRASLSASTTTASCFEPVARQLEAGGYDSATTANRMSGKALAENGEADKPWLSSTACCVSSQMRWLRLRARFSEQTRWLFIAAVVLALVVVIPLTLLNMLSICQPLESARQMALTIAGGDLARGACQRQG